MNSTKSVKSLKCSAVLIALGVALVGAGPDSCEGEELGYLLQQAPGQLELIVKRESFKKLLKDPELDPEVRAKLEFVLDVKNYAVEEIGLIQNKNYEVFVDIEDKETVVWNLTACEPLAMEPVKWSFPVVGEMPYLGFFEKEDALAKEAELEALGYDVYVRTAGAYSMLGIMSDPLYSPLLRYREADLANLVIHEMTHGTVFVKGQMNFNENLALFVGDQGAYEYLASRYGAESEEARYSKGAQVDGETFSKELMKLFDELDGMYKSEATDDEKRRRKAEIVAAHKRRFEGEVLPSMETTRYRSWLDKDINNATIYSRVVYYHDLTLYREIFEAMDEDLPGMVDFFKEVQQMKGVDAEGYAKEWLAKRRG